VRIPRIVISKIPNDAHFRTQSSMLLTWRRGARLKESRERTFDSAGVKLDLARCQGSPRAVRIALVQLAEVG